MEITDIIKRTLSFLLVCSFIFSPAIILCIGISKDNMTLTVIGFSGFFLLPIIVLIFGSIKNYSPNKIKVTYIHKSPGYYSSTTINYTEERFEEAIARNSIDTSICKIKYPKKYTGVRLETTYSEKYSDTNDDKYIDPYAKYDAIEEKGLIPDQISFNKNKKKSINPAFIIFVIHFIVFYILSKMINNSSIGTVGYYLLSAVFIPLLLSIFIYQITTIVKRNKK